jgi:hypothetical protein
MRRLLAFLLTAMLVVLFTAPAVSAGKFVTPQKADWFYVAGGSSDNVTTNQAYGHAQIVDPMGSAALIVNGVVQLAPNTGYAVWMRDLRYPAPGYTGDSITSYVPLGYYKLAWFMTDAFGYGDFQVKLFSDVLADGTYDIQIALNADPGTSAGYIGTTVIATLKYLTVSVHS